MDFEIKRMNDLLNNLVPPSVLEGLKNDKNVVDELEDVTLLFSDIVGFTKLSNNLKNP
jgi:class 3 adenylate cyclase